MAPPRSTWRAHSASCRKPRKQGLVAALAAAIARGRTDTVNLAPVEGSALGTVVLDGPGRRRAPRRAQEILVTRTDEPTAAEGLNVRTPSEAGRGRIPRRPGGVAWLGFLA